MARDLRKIDITHIPELVRLAEEVQTNNELLLLRRDSEDVAVLVPAKKVKRRSERAKTKADNEAFLSSAGSWKGLVDTDRVTDWLVGRREASELLTRHFERIASLKH